ncbi:hypothetical protein [Paenibacillus sp. B2(2019)]|nr:hypothetical protein [Paenibacillus sp. B2(2019)]
MTFEELYINAKKVINSRQLSEYASAGGVGAAILSAERMLIIGKDWTAK